MSTSPIKLPSLSKLAAQDFNLAALSLMQTHAVAQAVEVHTLHSSEAASPTNILADADALLPKGERLHQLYMETYIEMARQPIDNLEAVASALTLSAHHLEKVSVKQMSKNVSLAQHAQVEQVIATRYAQIMKGAIALEKLGVISSLHSERLTKLTDRPTGPLSVYYDKALVMLENQKSPEQKHVRDRMVA